MLHILNLPCALLLYLVAVSEGSEKIPNANHIFNALHSSMRQWGSSLNHNGMSFFLASVPRGTQFYHGTSTPEPVNGSEWLAFEPEHAMNFARPRRRRSPGTIHHDPQKLSTEDSKSFRVPETIQQPMPPAEGPSADAGYLHTYANAKDLRLLYLDGMAAAKCDKGTLDLEDRILLNDSLSGGGEWERAALVCEAADNAWQGRIDGFIRMEAGFEIILCHFERDLEVVRITQAKPVIDDGRRRRPPGGRRPSGFRNDWVKGVASRYYGIGGNRVRLNYDSFVTAYTYGLDLFSQDPKLPRLNHIPSDKLEPIRRDLHNLVTTHHIPDTSSFDWQAIADMIVIRYSDELQNLAHGNFTSPGELRERVEKLIGMFIDYKDKKNYRDITDRCSEQFIPNHIPRDTLSYKAVHYISKNICSTLTSALQTDDLDQIVTSLQDLIDYLSWTTWKDCRGCGYDELCLIPMWPMGTVDDYEHPHCQRLDTPSTGDSYWGSRPHLGGYNAL
ncbi:hypothetical protein F5884DRAFT_778332 [Xylogone sp. PMI_703]|nr:hypothetical protein F5884DRAFT_778332 [Xylogone sp. PMI_703]